MEVSTVRQQPVQRVEAAKRPEESRPKEAKPPVQEGNKPVEQPPKPVVNTQGQTTGRVLNVSA
jgi:hypothetical protein